MRNKKPEIRLQTTTLWDYPSQNYGFEKKQGDINYKGATPSFIVWNLLNRYTRPNDLIVDPMAGSGTALDVARDLKRRALGYDINPQRKDIYRVDARKLPIEDEKVDFVFIDPPYGDHIKYSDQDECIGNIRADDPAYCKEIGRVISEAFRIMKKNRYMAVYVSDSYKKDRYFMPLGFEIFGLLLQFFKAVDIICVKRYNAKLEKRHWHTAALEHNYYLRGFNYLFIMYKDDGKSQIQDRRNFNEIKHHMDLRAGHSG